MARTTVSVYLQTVTSGFQHGINQARKKWQSFTNYLKTTQGMVMSALGVGSFKSIIDGWDQMAKNARNLGVATDYYQKLTFAADRSNVAIEQVFETISRLKTAQGAALTGNAEKKTAFERIGISMEQLRTLRPQELFDTVTAALARMTDQAERNDSAAKLLGETYNKLGVFMNDYKSLGAELEASGGIISADTLEAAERFNDQITNIVIQLKSLIGHTGILQKIADGFEVIMATFTGEEKRVLEDATQKAAKAGVITRRGAIGYLLDSGKLSVNERNTLAALGQGWAEDPHKLAGIDLERVDKIMRKHGLGALAGTQGRFWGYTPGADFVDLPYTAAALGRRPRVNSPDFGPEFTPAELEKMWESALSDDWGSGLADTIQEELEAALADPAAARAAAVSASSADLRAAGDFSVAALSQRLGLKAADRTAKATEETARLAREILARVELPDVITYTD